MDAGDAGNEVEYFSFDTTLDKFNGLGLNLPVHMRNMAPNLTASVDANKAFESSLFKSANRKAISKTQKLWDQQSHTLLVSKRKGLVPNRIR